MESNVPIDIENPSNGEAGIIGNISERTLPQKNSSLCSNHNPENSLSPSQQHSKSRSVSTIASTSASSLQSEHCTCVWYVFAFLLGFVTVPLSIIVLVSLNTLPVSDRIRQNKYMRAATIGSIIGFLVATVIIVILRSEFRHS